MITCDEKWVYYNNTARTGEWSEVKEALSSVSKRTLTNKKVMLCIWWNRKGIIYKRYLKLGQTVDFDLYCDILRSVQDELLKTSRRLVTIKVVLFNQDNARPHVSKQAKNLLGELGWKHMIHPPYSPDIDLSDFYLFSALQLYLKGAIFNLPKVIILEVDDFFSSCSDHFWIINIENLPKR